jgi:hypothetical protein
MRLLALSILPLVETPSGMLSMEQLARRNEERECTVLREWEISWARECITTEERSLLQSLRTPDLVFTALDPVLRWQTYSKKTKRMMNGKMQRLHRTEDRPIRLRMKTMLVWVLASRLLMLIIWALIGPWIGQSMRVALFKEA